MDDSKSFHQYLDSIARRVSKSRQQKVKSEFEDNISFQSGIYIECEDPMFRFIVYMEKYDLKFRIIYAPFVSKRWIFEKVFLFILLRLSLLNKMESLQGFSQGLKKQDGEYIQ